MTKLLIAFTLFSVAALAQTAAGDTQKGKALFLKNGCYQCHGYAGQGGAAGARLAQIKLPQVAFIAYVRNPSPGGMPPYRAKIMTDQELADVYAYIKSFPDPLPSSSIPLLSQIDK